MATESGQTADDAFLEERADCVSYSRLLTAAVFDDGYGLPAGSGDRVALTEQGKAEAERIGSEYEKLDADVISVGLLGAFETDPAS